MNTKTNNVTSLVPAKQDDSGLTGAQKRIADRAIEDMHLAYYEKGGLRDAIEHAKKKSEGVSAHIYKLATYAAKNTPDLGAALDLFGRLCKRAEATYKEVHKVENVKDAIPVWAVFKSNIGGAMRDGLSPLGYKNEHALRDARDALQQQTPVIAHKRGTPALADNSSRAAAAGPDEIEQFLAQSGVHDSLRTIASITVLNLEYVKPSKRDEAAVIMKTANDQLAQLADRRKMQATG